MARKILGYVELIWTCDSCGTKTQAQLKHARHVVRHKP